MKAKCPCLSPPAPHPGDEAVKFRVTRRSASRAERSCRMSERWRNRCWVGRVQDLTLSGNRVFCLAVAAVHLAADHNKMLMKTAAQSAENYFIKLGTSAEEGCSAGMRCSRRLKRLNYQAWLSWSPVSERPKTCNLDCVLCIQREREQPLRWACCITESCSV